MSTVVCEQRDAVHNGCFVCPVLCENREIQGEYTVGVSEHWFVCGE